MKSLRQTRLDKGLTQQELTSLIGTRNNTTVSLSVLSYIERGINVPDHATRRRIEAVLGRINWLDVPRIPTEARRDTEWDETERDFRGLVRMIAGLPQEQQLPFLRTAIRHLQQFSATRNNEQAPGHIQIQRKRTK